MTAGREHGKVANQNNKILFRMPREEGTDCMHALCRARCPSLQPRLRDVAQDRLHAHAASKCPRAQVPNKHDQGMQQKNTTRPSSPDTLPTDTHSKNGSVLGTTFLDNHSNGPQPTPLNHTPKQLTPACLSHHEQSHSFPSSPCSGDGEPRTNLERSVIGTLARRDSELCSNTDSPMDSNGVEPGVTNPEPATVARTTIPPTTLPQDLLPCSGGSFGPSLSPLNKDITSPTNQAAKYSSKLL